MHKNCRIATNAFNIFNRTKFWSLVFFSSQFLRPEYSAVHREQGESRFLRDQIDLRLSDEFAQYQELSREDHATNQSKRSL